MHSSNTGNEDAQEMDAHHLKIEEKVKVMKSEIKENVQGINSDGKETRTQINSLDQKEEINIQMEQNEEKRIQKMRRGLGIGDAGGRGGPGQRRVKRRKKMGQL